MLTNTIHKGAHTMDYQIVSDRGEFRRVSANHPSGGHWAACNLAESMADDWRGHGIDVGVKVYYAGQLVHDTQDVRFDKP